MQSLFIIGAQRSGSTYLYKILDDHPEIFMAKPIRPEPKFFLDAEGFEKGKEHYEERYFSECTSKHKYMGEKSTSYIESSLAAERIKSFYPDAKILVILREPVARAYSNYRFSVDHGVEYLSFLDAMAEEEERLVCTGYSSSVSPYAYQARGHYINYIQEYLKVFERSQLHIMIFEEFIGNLHEISDLYTFLGVDNSIIPDQYESKVNESNVEIVDAVEKPSLQLAGCFEKSIRDLETVLGRSLDIWRRC